MRKATRRAIAIALASSLLLITGYLVMSPDNYHAVQSVPQLNVQQWTTDPLRAAKQLLLEASPEEVFEYISSAETLPEWMPGLKSLSYDHSNSASPGALGKGSRRRMMFGDQVELEEIVQFEQPNLIAYQILEGVPLRNHLAVMTVETYGNGSSTLTWYQYFDIQKSSVFGWFMPLMVRRFLNTAQENLLNRFGEVGTD